MTAQQTPLTPDLIHDRLDEILPAAAMLWVDQACAAVAADPSTVFLWSSRAAVRCGRDQLGQGFGDCTADDAARVLLLCSLPLDEPELTDAIKTGYRYGDVPERRAILRALGFLISNDQAVPLLYEALRSNDPRLVAAALGRYAAAHLDQPSWRDGVLKCLFMGVPLAEVAGLDHRIDAELIWMFRDYDPTDDLLEGQLRDIHE